MKIQGWEKLLVEHISLAHNNKFVWGWNDCALWCGSWILKATRKDPAALWRGEYTTEAQAKEIMATSGFNNYGQLADSMRYEKLQIAYAQRGDIVLHPQGCLGICDGVISYFLTFEGLVRLQTLRCVRAWRIE